MGDTVINAVKYQTVYAYPSTNTYNDAPYCAPFIVDTIPYLTDIYIREDVDNQKVYRYYSDEDSEELLFDFTLNAGDTINWMIIDTVYYYKTTDSISRKVLDFGYSGPEQPTFAMVEGIGGPWGPFEKPQWWFENYLFPMCYKIVNNEIYYSQCYELTTVDRKEMNPLEISYYPNPVKDFLTIDIPIVNTMCQVKVIDINGQLLKEELGSGSLKLDFSSFSPGVYFIKVYSGIEVSGFRVVKE